VQIDSAPFDGLRPSDCLCKLWLLELVPLSSFAKSGGARVSLAYVARFC
jgi:hypothetical protein